MASLLATNLKSALKVSNVASLAAAIAGIVGLGDKKACRLYRQSDSASPLSEITGLRIMSYNVVDDKVLCSHPLEDGAVLSDHLIDNPNEIVLRIAFPDERPSFITALLTSESTSDLKAELYDIFAKRGLNNSNPFFTIIIKGRSFPNMVIDSFPETRSGQQATHVFIDVKFKQVMRAMTNTAGFQAASPLNAITAKLGIKSAPRIG